MASLTKICNNVAAKALGEPGTKIQEVYRGRIMDDILTVSKIYPQDKGMLCLKSNYSNGDFGCFCATRFRKAISD